jgi:cytochrome c2
MRLVFLIAAAVVCAAMFGGLSAERTRRLESETRARDLTGGDPQSGAALARALGCVACHVMPGIRGPASHVGPALKDFGLRAYIAGTIENTADNLLPFLRDPRSVAPKTAMPNLRVTESQSRDLAAYLYAQR